MSIEPIHIRVYNDPESAKKLKRARKPDPNGDKKNDMLCFKGDFDLVPYFENYEGTTNVQVPG
jgi:hypothetical protein